MLELISSGMDGINGDELKNDITNTQKTPDELVNILRESKLKFSNRTDTVCDSVGIHSNGCMSIWTFRINGKMATSAGEGGILYEMSKRNIV